ncbi:MAG: AzlC family ABC transporter permease [Synergistales bacterium]|nr:AzlC family ABC transporter permease [Synergistales bacterium]
MTGPKEEFFRGGRSVMPILIGLMPFAVVFGFAMKDASMTGPQSTFFSLSLLAGASQLAAVHLYAAKTPALIIIATVIAINLRYSMYSLSLQDLFQKRSFGERLFAAFIVSDQSYAFTMTEVEKNPQNSLITFFFLGASVCIYMTWLAGIFLGYNLGTIIPAGLSLDFAIPLVFMSLLIPHLKGRDRQISALSGAVAAIILVPVLPLNSGLLVAMITGICCGMAYSSVKKKKVD